MGAVGDGVGQVCSGLKQSHRYGKNQTKPKQMSHIQAMVHLLHSWRRWGLYYLAPQMGGG